MCVCSTRHQAHTSSSVWHKHWIAHNRSIESIDRGCMKSFLVRDSSAQRLLPPAIALPCSQSSTSPWFLLRCGRAPVNVSLSVRKACISHVYTHFGCAKAQATNQSNHIVDIQMAIKLSFVVKTIFMYFDSLAFFLCFCLLWITNTPRRVFELWSFVVRSELEHIAAAHLEPLWLVHRNGEAFSIAF